MLGIDGVFALCFLGVFIVPSDAAGGVSIFELGSEVDRETFQVMYMYYIVFAITIFLELVVHQLHTNITTNSGTLVVHHIVTEVMILGGISAVLVVFENLGGSALIDAPLFHYVHFVIFVMANLFIVLVTSLFVTIQPNWAKWVKFEQRVTEVESDPSLCDQERTAFLAAFVKTAKNGNRMIACLCYFRQNLPSKFHHISFSRYMKKMQRKFMLEFLHLTVLSWFFLGVLCALAAGTDYVTIKISDNPLATIGLWVLIVGFGPLIVLVVLSFKVSFEFKNFTLHVQEMRQYRGKRLARAQSDYFWRGAPSFNVKLIQVMLLYQVFYLATVVINFSYRLWQHGKENGKMEVAALLIFATYAPSVVVFGYVLPKMLPNFTVLASLGEFIDHSVLLSILDADKKSGKNRRQFRRDEMIVDVAKQMRVETHDMLLSQENATIGAQGEVEEEMPLFKRRGEAAADPVITEEDRMEICCECEERVAVSKCDRCGLMCEDCDVNYHRLRHLKNHPRRLFEDPQEVPNDSFKPSFNKPVFEKKEVDKPSPSPPATPSVSYSVVGDSVSVVAEKKERPRRKGAGVDEEPLIGPDLSPTGLTRYHSLQDDDEVSWGGVFAGKRGSGGRRGAPSTSSVVSMRENWVCRACSGTNLYSQGRCGQCKVPRPQQSQRPESTRFQYNPLDAR